MSETAVALEADGAGTERMVANNKIHFSKEVKQVIDKVRRRRLANIFFASLS